MKTKETIVVTKPIEINILLSKDNKGIIVDKYKNELLYYNTHEKCLYQLKKINKNQDDEINTEEKEKEKKEVERKFLKTPSKESLKESSDILSIEDPEKEPKQSEKDFFDNGEVIFIKYSDMITRLIKKYISLKKDMGYNVDIPIQTSSFNNPSSKSNPSLTLSLILQLNMDIKPIPIEKDEIEERTKKLGFKIKKSYLKKIELKNNPDNTNPIKYNEFQPIINDQPENNISSDKIAYYLPYSIMNDGRRLIILKSLTQSEENEIRYEKKPGNIIQKGLICEQNKEHLIVTTQAVILKKENVTLNLGPTPEEGEKDNFTRETKKIYSLYKKYLRKKEKSSRSKEEKSIKTKSEELIYILYSDKEEPYLSVMAYYNKQYNNQRNNDSNQEIVTTISTLFSVTEDFGKNLKQLIESKKNGVIKSWLLILNMITEFKKLHSKEIIHGDIKLSNICHARGTKETTLIDPETMEKQIDLEVREEQEANSSKQKTKVTGTVGYLPDIKKARNETKKQIEIFQMGRTISELLFPESLNLTKLRLDIKDKSRKTLFDNEVNSEINMRVEEELSRIQSRKHFFIPKESLAKLIESIRKFTSEKADERGDVNEIYNFFYDFILNDIIPNYIKYVKRSINEFNTKLNIESIELKNQLQKLLRESIIFINNGNPDIVTHLGFKKSMILLYFVESYLINKKILFNTSPATHSKEISIEKKYPFENERIFKYRSRKLNKNYEEKRNHAIEALIFYEKENGSMEDVDFNQPFENKMNRYLNDHRLKKETKNELKLNLINFIYILNTLSPQDREALNYNINKLFFNLNSYALSLSQGKIKSNSSRKYEKKAYVDKFVNCLAEKTSYSKSDKIIIAVFSVIAILTVIPLIPIAIFLKNLDKNIEKRKKIKRLGDDICKPYKKAAEDIAKNLNAKGSIENSNKGRQNKKSKKNTWRDNSHELIFNSPPSSREQKTYKRKEQAENSEEENPTLNLIETPAISVGPDTMGV